MGATTTFFAIDVVHFWSTVINGKENPRLVDDVYDAVNVGMKSLCQIIMKHPIQTYVKVLENFFAA